MNANIVVYYRPQKVDNNRVRITAGGNLINYPGELTTRTADLKTFKILWNSIVRTINAKQMYVDIDNFYLCTLLYQLEYLHITFSEFLEHITKQYKLKEKELNGYIYVEIRRSIYSLQQAGSLVNNGLKVKLAPHGCFEDPTLQDYSDTSPVRSHFFGVRQIKSKQYQQRGR